MNNYELLKLYNNTNEFKDYKFIANYYIVWLFTEKERWYQKVNKEQFEDAKHQLWKNNNNEKCIPYLLYTEYYIYCNLFHFPLEVSKEIYEYIKNSQKRIINHEHYINKKYRDRTKDEFIEELAISNFLTDEKVIHREFDENFANFIKKSMNETEFSIFYNFYFYELSQAEIARKLGVSRQYINKNMISLKIKFKKFFKIWLTNGKKIT